MSSKRKKLEKRQLTILDKVVFVVYIDHPKVMLGVFFLDIYIYARI